MSRSTKAKRAAGSSRRKRQQPQPDVPALFRSNPEENFSLWVQSCFPDASLPREDAIRQWLARPLEARVQGSNNHRAEIAKSDGSETHAATPPEARLTAHSNGTDGIKPRGWLGWNSHLVDGSEEDPFADRFALWMRNHSRFLLRLARYSFVALLVVKVLWGAPMSKVASLAHATIAAAQRINAEPAAGSSVPQRRETIKTRSDSAAAPMIIQSLSVGCEETQPCVEITTRGKGTLPRLSTLSDPDRVVMDFQGAVFSSDVHRIAVGRGAVRAVRIGEDATQPPHTRVVIDLTEKCDYELQTLTDRVVLRVYSKAIPRQVG